MLDELAGAYSVEPSDNTGAASGIRLHLCYGATNSQALQLDDGSFTIVIRVNVRHAPSELRGDFSRGISDLAHNKQAVPHSVPGNNPDSRQRDNPT